MGYKWCEYRKIVKDEGCSVAKNKIPYFEQIIEPDKL